ncbi:LppA family lipoprotein [Rhodococcus sp. NPDC058521]|uniref:LppA family lipoprotein n=1 Tax=Rhodococcus sp. NPDC058521 TaxID=3346536 RepID=UPI00365BF004
MSTAILMGGCGDVSENPYNFEDTEVAAAAERMHGWPTLAESEQLVTDTVVRIGDAATAIAPELRWNWSYDRSQGTCSGPYSNTDGVSVTTQLFGADLPIRDEVWDAVLDAAARVAAEAGMDRRDVQTDQPGHHDVTFESEDGNKITLGTYKASSIRGTTGCRYE